MDKTVKYWSGRLFYLGVALLMALGLLLSPAAAPPAAAAEPDSEWQMVETPNMDDWVVAPGSDAYLLAMGLDGETIYVIGTMWNDTNGNGTVDPGEEVAKLWRSVNGGATWKDITDNVLKEVEKRPAGENKFAWFNYVVVPMDDSDFVVVAGYLGNMTLPGVPDAHNWNNWKQVVLVSEDGGKEFDLLPEPIRDSKAGTELTDIYSINVAPEVDDVRQIAVVGTSDPDHSVRLDTSKGAPNADGDEDGLVYRYQYGGEEYWEDVVTGAYGWVNCSAVTFAWFSQTMFLSDNTLVVYTARTGGPWGKFNDNKTYVQTGVLIPEEEVYWNDQAKRGDAVLLDNRTVMWWTLKGTAGGVTLPLDYDGRDKDKRCFLARSNLVDTSIPFTDQQTIGTIYTIEDDYAEPLEKQLPRQPWLGMVYYWGTISEGNVVAGTLGKGYIPESLRFASIIDQPAIMNLYLLTDLDWEVDPAYPPRVCQGPQVYRNELTDMNTDARWKAASKPPSGHMAALSIIAPPAGNKVYCLVTPLTMGIVDILSTHIVDKYDEGAFQVSFDAGDTWQQLSLIDTDIDNLTDVAPSPDGNTTYLASINTVEIPWGGNPFDRCDSVWLKSSKLSEGLPQARSYNDQWLRVWYGEISSNFSLLRLAPEDPNYVCLLNWGTRTVYFNSLMGLGEWDVNSKAPFDIVDLAVRSATALYALSADGSVAMCDGYRWPSANKVDSELKTGNDIAVLGDNVLVGGASGDVSYSSDAGLTFTELKDGLPEDGYVFVAFDSYFDTNSVVYAAVGNSTDENGVYRWVIDQSEEWKNLGADDGLFYLGIALDNAEGNPQTSAATGGVLYALYYNGTANQSGVARCLTPAKEVCCGKTDWDYLERGETGFDDVLLFLFPLRIYGGLTPGSNSVLLAIDFSARYYNGTLREEQPKGTFRMGRVWSFEDCFARAAPVVTAPADGALINADPCNCWNDAFTLKWDRQCDACKYDIQIATDPEFTEIAARYSGSLPVGDWDLEFVEVEDGANPNYVVPNRGLGDGSCGSTYYWRIRSRSAETGQNITSPWSDARAFTVGAGPEAQVKLTYPDNGAVVSPANIQFTWDPVPDATGYVFSLTNPVTDTEVVAPIDVADTTYTYAGTLSYDNPYLWTVKAMKGEVVFGQATATFTTSSAAVEPQEPSTPAWVWVVIVIGAVAWLVILVLIFRARRA